MTAREKGYWENNSNIYCSGKIAEGEGLKNFQAIGILKKINFLVDETGTRLENENIIKFFDIQTPNGR